MTQALAEAQSALDTIAGLQNKPLNYANTLGALEAATEELGRAWALVTHLDNVANSEALRTAHNTMLPKISDFYTGIYLNTDLWKTIQAYSATPEAQQLTGAKKRFMEETLADFMENGANLSDSEKTKLAELQSELAQVTQKYAENVLDSTHAWEWVSTDAAELDGLPQSALDAARQSAEEKQLGSENAPKWRLTLQAPSLLPALKHLKNNALRKTIWEASSKIGSTGEHNNKPLIEKIVHLRNEKATLLGHSSFADFVLTRRMAKNGATALQFIEDLHQRVKPAFESEIHI